MRLRSGIKPKNQQKRRHSASPLYPFALFVQHPVADTQFVDEITVITGPAAQFFADVCHVDLQLLDAAVIHTTPDGADNGRIGQHLTGMLAQQGQNIIFRLGQVDQILPNADLAPVIVDDQVTDHEDAAGCCHLHIVPGAAQGCPDSCQQFGSTEGFCDIIK